MPLPFMLVLATARCPLRLQADMSASLSAALLHRIAIGKDPVLTVQVRYRPDPSGAPFYLRSCIVHNLQVLCHTHHSSLTQHARYRSFLSFVQVVGALFVIGKLGKVFSVLTWTYVGEFSAFAALKPDNEHSL